ncbi:MAG TPA: DNA primase, partial [Acidimicrobiales bacterium]|nr:DNA primase [Acidimicrobiales bacterium]
MGIKEEDIARVRAASDLVQIAGEHLALRKVGRRWVGLCPFHAEKTPSFSVNAEEGLYYCFGCSAKGDVITFVREVEHLEFAEAVERLAARAGIHITYDDAAVGRERQRRAILVEAMAAAVEWYHQRLLTAPDAAPARAYLRSRGYDGDVVRAYRLGWAPDEWDALCRALRVPLDVLTDTGLGLLNRLHRQQDTFRSRIMFPIFDVRGDPVAFGGRALPGGDPPKYRNSPETPLYSKSRLLYGLNWAKGPVVAAGEVVVCEGYTDVIGLAQAGVPTAVATCGTALADQHVHTLKNFARRIVLAYDADAAGRAAAGRFYEWERRYELDIAVASLPPGTDPGDLARRDPQGLQAAVADARPFLAFRLDQALAGADLRAAEGRARAASAALAVIAEHPDDLVRDQYLMEVADRTRIDPDRLRAQLAQGPRTAPERPAVARRRPARGGPEIEALRVAVHQADALAGRLHAVLFADDVARAAWRALEATASGPGGGASSVHAAIEAADPEAAALLQRLAVEETDADAADVLVRLADEAARRALAEREADARKADDPMGYAPLIGWLKLTMEELREPVTADEAAHRLIGWLMEREGPPGRADWGG